MNFELIINRIGAFAGDSAQVLVPSDDIAKAFRLQLANMVHGDDLKLAYQTIIETACNAGYAAKALEPDPKLTADPGHFLLENAFRDASKSNDVDSRSPLVGLLPSHRIAIQIGEIEWVVRTRVSVTACAMQDSTNATKLWLTFEGVPMGRSGGELHENAARDFINATDVMGDAGMAPLSRAYKTALEQVSGKSEVKFPLSPKRIFVRMTDNNDIGMAALIHELYFEGQSVNKIRSRKTPSRNALEGLRELETLVAAIDPSIKVGDMNTSVVGNYDGSRGVYVEKTSDNKTFALGIARKTGTVAGFEVLAQDERYTKEGERTLRVMSAARPISARIANELASRNDAYEPLAM